MSQSLQIRSVISIRKGGGGSRDGVLWVAIPSNQVGNFHQEKREEKSIDFSSVAIPSNQVGNFHRPLLI